MKLKFKMPRHWSIRWKLTHIAMLTTTAALVLTILGLAVFEYFTVRQHLMKDLEAHGAIIGGNSTAAILFNRADDARATLATLSVHPSIRGASVYDGEGKILATYTATGEKGLVFASAPRPQGFSFPAGQIDVYMPVMMDGKAIGTVYLRSDLSDLYGRLITYAYVSPIILLLASGLGLLLVNRMQRQVSEPIITLAETSRRVSEENDYSLRVPRFGDDELGRLGEAFNHMLEGIRERDEQIKLHLSEVKVARDELEARVEARTADLKNANEELQLEMGQRQEAEKKRAEMQANLVEASRKAGMADVATGVLHNVGNVLNSVNVSTQMVHEAVKASRVTVLAKAADMLREHAGDLPAFLTADERGKTLPLFLCKVAGALAEENVVMLKEIDGLASNIAHIREIVAMQQNLARVSGIETGVTLGELIEDAIKINHAGLNRHQVTIERDYDPQAALVVDRHKVLQILINLISNAKYAVNGTLESVRRVRISGKVEAGSLRVAVADNGVGIAAEQMTRIFGFGFTTKKNGHGFGLHSSVLAAKEMGGTLEAVSPGAGQGATFTLAIPLIKESACVN